MIVDHETLAYSAVRSFDDLPIPFRCVSTELVSGEAHVFHDGPIGVAMRSTMSLPGIAHGLFNLEIPTGLAWSSTGDLARPRSGFSRHKLAQAMLG